LVVNGYHASEGKRRALKNYQNCGKIEVETPSFKKDGRSEVVNRNLSTQSLGKNLMSKARPGFHERKRGENRIGEGGKHTKKKRAERG